jgi:CBS domain-containing protein
MPVLVKDLMSSPVITIDQEKTVKEAGQLMKKHRKGALIVLRKGKPVGIITDSDLVKRVVATGLNSAKLKVKQIMSKPLVTINADDDILTAVRKMKKINIHRLPVLDKGKIVGLLSLTDIARTSPEMLDLLEYRLKMKEEEPVIEAETTAGICESCSEYSERLKNINRQWLCEECIDDLKEE